LEVLKTHEAIRQVKDAVRWNRLLIHGDEDYLTEQFVKKVSSVKPVEKFYLSDGVEPLFRFTGTSLFGGATLPVVFEAELLPRLLSRKEPRKRFFSFLKSLDAFILVSYQEIEKKTLRSEPFSGVLKMVDAVLHSDRYPEGKTMALVARKLESAGKRVSPELVKLVVYGAGSSLRHLRTEVEKLTTYPGELDEETVEGLLYSGERSHVFELFPLLVEGRRKAYLSKLEGVLKAGVEPLMVLGFFQSQLRRYILRLEQSGRAPASLLRSRLMLLKKLHEKEFAVKRGLISGEDALRLLAFEV
jgi:DNA polymerase-3 subunit delta